MSWGWRPSGLPHPYPSRPRRPRCPPGCPGPSPGQAAEKQAWVWSSGPGQSCSTRSLGGEQRRLRACTPGPHVRLQGSHGLQGPQAPQPCSSGEEPASPAGPQSGRPSHTWGDVGQSSFLVGGTMALPKAPPTPPPTLTCWKPMQRPSGQEYSGQGAWVPLGPPGADSPSEGKGRESTVRQGAAATSCLALHQGTQVPLPQASSSSPWGQSGTPSQSRSGCRHTWGAEAQGKRSPHGGSWVEPVDTEVSPCAPAPPGLSLQRGWQEWLEAWSGSRWETEPRCTRIPGRCCNLRAVALYFWERWPGHGGLTPRGTKGTPKSGEEEPPNRPAPQTQTQRAPPSRPGHPFLPKCRQKQKPLSPLPWAWVEGSSLQREFHEKGQRRPMPQT